MTDVGRGRTADRMSASPFSVVAAATIATVLTVMPVFLFGAFVVLVRDDIAISDGQLGISVSTFFFASMASSVAGGRLADSIGPRRGMTVGAVLSLISILGIGVAASVWWHVAGFMFAGGVGSGIGMPSSNLLLANEVSVERRGVAFGIKQAAAPMASVVAGFAVPLLGLTIGWRWSLIGTAIVLVVLLLTLSGERGAGGAVLQTGGSSHRAPLAALVLLAVMSGFAGASATVTIGFFVESAVERGFETATAGIALGVGSAFGIAARIGWGWLADRRESGHLAFISWLFLVGSSGFALLGIVETVPLLILASIVVFSAGWSWSGLVFLVATLGSPGAPATATGIAATGGGLGGLLGPLIFGVLVSVWSYTVAWAVTASWMLVAAVLARATLIVWLRLPVRRGEV
jgi:MFS family permease